jgi:hypothetical protein
MTKVQGAQARMTYKSVMSFEFTNLVQKLVNTPTSNKNASHIHKIYKALDAAGTKIREEFKAEVLSKFALKDENGGIKTDEHGTYEPDPAQMEEYNKAMTEFEARECVIDWRPLTPDTLSDVKVTAKEIDLLGPLYSEQNGPGVPHALHSL